MNFSVVVEALFEGARGRLINRAKLAGRVPELENGNSLLQMIADVVSSPECKEHQKRKNDQLEVTLPDLTQMHSERYSSLSAEKKVFHAYDNAGIELMESLIVRYRYYERLGIWRPTVDLDKRVTAAIIEGMGARSCIELGCFSGAVLGLLAAQGIDICGVEVSHRAFLLADNCTYEQIRFGNLVDQHFDRQFDAFLRMDILEHLSPLTLSIYINKRSPNSTTIGNTWTIDLTFVCGAEEHGNRRARDKRLSIVSRPRPGVRRCSARQGSGPSDASKFAKRVS